MDKQRCAADLVQISIDEDTVPNIKSVHHKQEDDTVKHGGNSVFEDETERHDGSCHCGPQVCHIHLHSSLAQLHSISISKRRVEARSGGVGEAWLSHAHVAETLTAFLESLL